MATLILSLDGDILQELELNKPRITIGRRPYNDIAIDNLAVSGEHAAVVQVGNDWVLEDSGSTNGTVLNGTQTEKHLLKDNDLIEIGKFHIKFVAGKTHQDTDFEKTMLIRSPFAGKSIGGDTQAAPVVANPAEPFPTTFSPEMPAPHAAPEPPAAPAAPAQPHAALRVLTGKQAGSQIPLTKPLTSIGKKDVQVAVITHRPSGYFLNHVQGDRTPAINSIPISDKPHALNHRDLIEIAGVRMEFLLQQ